MLFRVRMLAVVTAVALTGIAAACSASSRAVVACAPAGSHRLASSASAEVYSAHGFVSGCSDATHLRTRLGRTTSCIRSHRIGPVRVAAQVAAYGEETCGVDTGFTSVVVRRLSDGKLLSSDAAATSHVRPESYEAIDSLVLKRGGSVAWIAVARSLGGGGGANIEVHRRDKRGSTLLDSGSAIDPGSLELRRSRLTWTDGGATRATTLI